MTTIYEPIDSHDLKDFALLDLQGTPRSKPFKLFLIQAISYALIVEGPIEAFLIANYPEQFRPSSNDPRWDWHLTEAESLEMMRLLLDTIQETPV